MRETGVLSLKPNKPEPHRYNLDVYGTNSNHTYDCKARWELSSTESLQTTLLSVESFPTYLLYAVFINGKCIKMGNLSPFAIAELEASWK